MWDSTDYRDSPTDNNYENIRYYHADVTSDGTPSYSDNQRTADWMTYTGSTTHEGATWYYCDPESQDTFI